MFRGSISSSEAQLLFSKGLEGTRNLSYTAAGLSVVDGATPKLQLAAQQLLVDVTRRDLRGRQEAADQIQASLRSSPQLVPAQVELLRAYTQLPLKFEIRDALANVPAEVMGDLRRQINAYETVRAELTPLVEQRYGATVKELQVAVVDVEALPADQQPPRWRELFERVRPLEALRLWLPDEMTGPAEKLGSAIYVKAYPES